MMRTLSEVVLTVRRVDHVELATWIERGWVVPKARPEGEPVFSDLDVARVCLICDLRHDLMVDEEAMDVVLPLLDQIYALRRRMNALTDAVRSQPEDVRRAVLEHLRRRDAADDILDL